jgi:hypothetical protein
MGPFKQAADRVFELHQTLGRCGIGKLYDIALQSGIFPDEVLDKFTRNGGMAFCRDALKRKDLLTGLPLAKPVGRGTDAEWQQLILFSCDEYVDLLNSEYEAIEADLEEFRKLYQNGRSRFGNSIPKYPLLDQSNKAA